MKPLDSISAFQELSTGVHLFTLSQVVKQMVMRQSIKGGTERYLVIFAKQHSSVIHGDILSARLPAIKTGWNVTVWDVTVFQGPCNVAVLPADRWLLLWFQQKSRLTSADHHHPRLRASIATVGAPV